MINYLIKAIIITGLIIVMIPSKSSKIYNLYNSWIFLTSNSIYILKERLINLLISIQYFFLWIYIFVFYKIANILFTLVLFFHNTSIIVS